MKRYYSRSFYRNFYLQQPSTKYLLIQNICAGLKFIVGFFARVGLTTLFLFALIGTNALGQTQVFLDNFNRAILNSGTPTAYSITVTNGDGGAVINTGSFLELTNDASAATNADGIVFVSGMTQDFLSPYSQTLHSNSSTIEWTFNFRYNRTTNPSGLAASNYGTAIILAISNSVFAGTGAGNGYAVVFGSSGTPDPIRLVKFSGGLTGTVTNIISSGSNDISNVNNYVSVRVKYEPNADNWSLFIRDDGSSNWADPSAGVTNQKGSTTSDNTYTSIPLTHFGFYWAYATAISQTSQFDNLGVLLTNTNTPTITVSTSSLPSFGTISVGNYSNPQNFIVSGTNLTNNIDIIPPTGFEIRTGTNPFSANPMTIQETSGSVPQINIDVRFNPGAAGTFSGNITCATPGANTITIAVSGMGSSPGLELFVTSNPSLADVDHAVLFPHAGMGTGTVYSADDWTYNTPTMKFYVVPVGLQSIGASELEINWDAAKADLIITNGNMFDFFAQQDISAGKKRINVGASTNLNISPSTGKYLAQLEFTVIQPGFNEITITGY